MDGDESRGYEPREPDRLDRLCAVVDRFQRAGTVDQVYRESVEGLHSMLAVDLCALLADGEGDGLRVRAWIGASPEICGVLESSSPWASSPEGPRPLVLSPEDPPLPGHVLRDALGGRGLRALAFVPLVQREELVGELVLGRTDAGFSEQDIRLAEIVAGHAARSIREARACEEGARLTRRLGDDRSALESMVDQLPVGILLAEVPTGRIVCSNARIEEIWGTAQRQVKGIADYIAWGGLDDAGRPLDPACWPLAQSVLEGATVLDREIAIQRADGERKIVRMDSAPVRDGRGRVIGAVAAVLDVTGQSERKRGREALERATCRLNASVELGPTLEAAAEVAVGPFADWSLVYLECGDVVRVAAAAHRDAAVGERLGVLRGRELAAGGASRIREVLRRGGPLAIHDPEGAAEALAAGDKELLGLAERVGCQSAVLLPLRAPGAVKGVMAAVRTSGRLGDSDVRLLEDLAARASLAIQNASAFEEARAANQAKANFLAVLSHEFRTPLSAILGYADILVARVHGDLTPSQQGDIERVKASVRHLSQLVDEIVSFTGMEAGRERVLRAPIDLRRVVSDSVSLMEPSADAAGLSLQLTLPDAPVVVETDDSKVRQIVINLVSNAVKYTPSGGIRVDLQAEETAVWCHVADTGPGIAPEHAEHVFEPFWQLEANDRRSGTGLGLAVSRQLARLLGGDLVLDSTPGRGSRFTLILPRSVPGVARDSAQ